MVRTGWFVLLALGALTLGFTSARSASAQEKGTVVDLDGLKSRAPADWKEEKVSGTLRHAQFRLPKVNGDKEDAELVIFRGIGGSAQQNIERWKSMFVAPEGKKASDIAKVTELKIGNTPVPYLQICGTYKSRFPPFDPNAKEVLKPNYCMLAVAYEGKQNPYHIRIVGPEKTVEHYKKGFDDWIKGFK